MIKSQENISAENVCRQIYKETNDFYKSTIEPVVNKKDDRFQILYGPPLVNTPILFIGYQPGNGDKTPEEEAAYGSEQGWPEVCEYAVEKWRLATNMQGMFGKELLEKCVGLNAIFIRAANIKAYRKAFGASVRKQTETFCLQRVAQIIEAVRPKKIVAIGFSTLELFDQKSTLMPDLISKKGRVLTMKGKIFGQDAISVLHLSGSRISLEDRKDIARHIHPL